MVTFASEVCCCDQVLLPGSVVSNNSQCQITRIRATARARSRKFLYAGLNFLGLGLGLIIHTSRANLILRVIWQCDIFGTTPACDCLHVGFLVYIVLI